MAAPKGLNPHAPEYIPLFHQTTPSTLIPTLPAHSSVPSPTPLPPPPVAEPPPAAVVSHVVPLRRTPRFCGRGTERRRELGFRPHQNRKEVRLAGKRGNLGNKNNDPEIHQDSLHKRCERRSFLMKHEVLPLSLHEEKTTVMIKNIPKEYTYALFLKFLEEHCMSEKQKNNPDKEDEEDAVVSAFDFMYLPVDFRNGCSRGFAFVNFTDARAVWKFHKACHGKRWDLFKSPKIREIVSAIIQGKEALVKHFENSTFICESDEFLPVCFSPPRDGSVDQRVEETRIGRRISSVKPNA